MDDLELTDKESGKKVTDHSIDDGRTIVVNQHAAADRTVVVGARKDNGQDASADRTVVVGARKDDNHDASADRTVVVGARKDDNHDASADRTVVVGARNDENHDAADRTIVVSALKDNHQDVAVDRTIVVGDKNFDAQNNDDDLYRTNRPHELVPEPMDDDDNGIDEEYVKPENAITLKGETYTLVRSLSENSGEAQIFLVEKDGKQYALKVYYPNFDINKKMMQVIHNFQFEMIVDLMDYGKVYLDGKRRSYELMEYLRGGTLHEVNAKGDLNRFRRIALQAAASLSYCHQNNVLHKDVKPSNFFFRDEASTHLVLGDFGISALFDSDRKTVRTTQARTPVYAAPEMYVDVIDGEVELTPAADFYSLGMTLFAVWLGENPMSANERTMMRQKSEGRLPRLEELPPRVKRLIQGLTVVNPLNRWKYEEVERWFLGEDVPVDEASPFLRYKSFIVDPERNLVADNIQELIPMLLENEQLAENYLYNGRIVTWLEACGNLKLSAVVKDLITNRYPVDKKAGLMASVYVMDPSYAYYDVQKEACDDVHSIALSLLSYKERYAMELQNPNDSLFLWLEAHTKLNIKRLQSYFYPEAEPHVAVMRMVYEIDPDIPFLVNHASSSLKDIVQSFGLDTHSEDDWHALVDGRLLSWMYCHEDVMACESLKIMTQGQTYSKSLAYKILYNLDRSAAYDLRQANTPEAIGKELSDLLKAYQHTPNQDLEAEMQDFTDPNGRFQYYAQMQGWYQLIADTKQCFDMTSKENIERLSAYDLHTALYRFCLILGITPVYQMPNNIELHCLEDLEDKQQANALRNEIRTGSLSQWMAVFFHENPHADFSEEFSYEKSLEQWVMAMGKVDAQQRYYKRLVKAREDTDERISSVRHDWRIARFREFVWRYTYYALVVFWLGLIGVVGIDDHAALLNHPYMSIMLPVGGMTGVIIAVRLFFNGISPFLGVLVGGLGVASAIVPIWILKLVDAHAPSLFNVAIILLSIIYVVICHFTSYHQANKLSARTVHEILTSDDVNTHLLEPLYYTFKTKSFRYKSTKFSLLDDISNQVRSISGENVIHYFLWGMLFVILILEFCVFSPKMLNKNMPFYEDKAQQVIEQVQTQIDQ